MDQARGGEADGGKGSARGGSSGGSGSTRLMYTLSTNVSSVDSECVLLIINKGSAQQFNLNPTLLLNLKAAVCVCHMCVMVLLLYSP